MRSVREGAGLPKTELARRLGIDRATVSRWETGSTRPEDSDVVQRFAELFGIDLDDALIAAGLRPQTAARPEPPPAPADPELVRLMAIMGDPDTTDETRQQIVAMLRAMAELAERQPRRLKRRGA